MWNFFSVGNNRVSSANDSLMYSLQNVNCPFFDDSPNREVAQTTKIVWYPSAEPTQEVESGIPGNGVYISAGGSN
jgi:hypothetical protein